MKPINIIQRLNESTSESFDRFEKDLETALIDAGYKVDITQNSPYSRAEDQVFITASKGKNGINIYLYPGGNNISDFEVDTVGIGGDNEFDTVCPLVQSGWDYDNAGPSEVNMKPGEEVYAIFKDIDATTPREVIRIVDEAFEAHDNKINESSLKEENRYGNTEDDDPVLDKTIKVYDINDYVDKEINTEEGRNYKAFNYPNGAAIIVTSDGEGAILDYEAVGVSFNSTSDTIYLNLCEKDTDDGNGHMKVAIMPSARVKVTIDELLKSPSKEMKVRDFFEKYNYNDRCARNFDEIKHYLTECNKQLKESDNINSYYVISENDFNKLLELNGGAFEDGYLSITVEEANELAGKQGLVAGNNGINSGE